MSTYGWVKVWERIIAEGFACSESAARNLVRQRRILINGVVARNQDTIVSKQARLTRR